MPPDLGPARPASTVVLLRDEVLGPEVFLLRRHGQSGFMAGATVFPGGKVDADDCAVGHVDLCAAACAQALDMKDGPEARGFFVAALRELHEESHVLLATKPDGAAITQQDITEFEADLQPMRQGHRLAGGAWHQLIEQRGWILQISALHPFAHWLTPRVEPRRFDTYFFCAILPQGQQASLDPHEATHAFWLRPGEALDQHNQGGEILLPPPTLHTLAALDERPGPADAWLRALKAQGPGPLIEPWFLANTPQGPAIVLHDDPSHPQPSTGEAQPRCTLAWHRFVLQDGRFHYIRAQQ